MHLVYVMHNVTLIFESRLLLLWFSNCGLPSGKVLRSIRTKASHYKNRFFLTAVALTNKPQTNLCIVYIYVFLCVFSFLYVLTSFRTNSPRQILCNLIENKPISSRLWLLPHFSFHFVFVFWLKLGNPAGSPRGRSRKWERFWECWGDVVISLGFGPTESPGQCLDTAVSLGYS